MPVLALNSGRMWPKRPESSVDVVEATTIDLSCAMAQALNSRLAATAIRKRRLSMLSPRISCSDEQVAANEFPGLDRSRRLEEGGCRGALDHPAAMEHDDLARQAPRLAEIVGRHHHLDAARDDGTDHILERLGRRRIEACGRLVEEQHGGIA